MTERGFLGMPYLRCSDCEEMVYLKPLLGTWHFCLTDQEREMKQSTQIWAAAAKRAAEARALDPRGIYERMMDDFGIPR